MFSVHCPEAGAEVLLGPSRYLSLHNTSQGIVTYFRCRCGTIGVLVTGRATGEEKVYHPEPGRPAGEPAAAVPGGAIADCA